ncbi:sensor histidine kinase [Arthrobacter sp. 7Tela_A1]|uniref:sensor histidine kinase n=1 Tax=Arthrobacter sp. 7Tela_A1 TaxID=3093745 RepID=UPI003BB5907D
MPTIRPTPSIRSGRWDCRPPASVARPAPVTPAAPLEVRLGVAGDEGSRGFELTVRDSGPGIPAESRTRIFEQGFSTKDPVQTAGAGRGFGLALVNQAVLRLGGTLDVGSHHAGGARFTVRLPLPEGARP